MTMGADLWHLWVSVAYLTTRALARASSPLPSRYPLRRGRVRALRPTAKRAAPGRSARIYPTVRVGGKA